MKSFTHYNARTVKEALGILSKYEGRAKVNAGGTDLLDTLKERVVPDYPDALINIKTIGDLNYIREEESVLRIGAVTRLSEITASPLIKERYSLLSQAAGSVATPLIRNMSTIGGNLAQDVRCWYYRYPQQLGGPIVCLRKGGNICNALTGDNRYHSIFGAATLDEYGCSTHCPAGTNIPGYLTGIKDGNMNEAARLLMKFNPMPAVTGRVCPSFCEPQCNRRAFDDPVAIQCIERSIGDQVLKLPEKFFNAPAKESGKSVAVVGSGPAGLSAAYYCRKAGHKVTVFEKMAEAGGMLSYSIPAYRLARDVVRRQVLAFQSMGINFELNADVGKNPTVEAISEAFDAVFLGAGAWKEKEAGIEGEKNMLSGLDFLNNVSAGERKLPGKKVAIIGGGNVALDVARTLVRLGAEPSIIYRRGREEMPAFPDEIKKAEEEKIGFRFLTLPTEAKKSEKGIMLTCVGMKLGDPDESGRRSPVPEPGSEFSLHFDAVIKAIGEEADDSFVPKKFRQNIRKKATGNLGKNLFAGGDFVSGPSTVVEAIASGREAAGLIDVFLDVDSQETVEKEKKGYSSSFVATPRLTIPELSVGERIKSLDLEETYGMPLEAIEEEARRCFGCGCIAVNPSDIGLALIALDAKIVTTKRTLGAETFFTASAKASNVLEEGELITEIQIPRPPQGARQGYKKFTLRKPVDFAVVSVASVTSMDNGQCKDARIALGAVGPSPFRSTAAEDMLKGKSLDEVRARKAAEAALIAAQPLAMNEYKVEIAKSLIKDAIMGKE